MQMKKSVSFVSRSSRMEKLNGKVTAALNDKLATSSKVKEDAPLVPFSKTWANASFPFSNKAVLKIVIYFSLFTLILTSYYVLWVLIISLEKPLLQWYDQPSVLPYLWYPSDDLLEFRSTFTANSSNIPHLSLVIEKFKNSILLSDERLSVTVDGSLLRNKPQASDHYFAPLYNQTNSPDTVSTPCIQVAMYLHFGFYYWTSETQFVYIHVPQTGEVKLAFEPYNFFSLRDQYAVYTFDVTATVGLCPHHKAAAGNDDNELAFHYHQFVTHAEKKDQMWVREKLEFFYLRRSNPEDRSVVTTPRVLAACCQDIDTAEEKSPKEASTANLAKSVEEVISNTLSAEGERLSSTADADTDDLHVATAFSSSLDSSREQAHKIPIEHSTTPFTQTPSATPQEHIQHLMFPSCSLSLPRTTLAHAIPLGHSIRFIQPEMMSTIQPLQQQGGGGYRLQVKLQIAAVYAHVSNGVRVVLTVNNVRYEFRRFFQLFPLSKDVQRQSLELWTSTSKSGDGDNMMLRPVLQLEQLHLQHEATLTIDNLKAGEINVLKVYILTPLLVNDDTSSKKEEGVDCEWMHNDLIYRCKFDDKNAAREEELSEILDYDCRTINVS